jgi:hypothetical protein
MDAISSSDGRRVRQLEASRRAAGTPSAWTSAEVKDDLNRRAEPEEPLPDLVINGYYLLGYDWRETAKAWAGAGFEMPQVMIGVANRTETAARIKYAFEHRTRLAYAMARDGDLPEVLTALHPRHGTPARAVWLTGLLMAALVLLIDLGRVVAVSTFSLLLYCAIANVCALRLESGARRYGRAVPLLGVASCLLLLAAILFISPRASLIGVGTLTGGTGYYYLLRRRVLLQQG